MIVALPASLYSLERRRAGLRIVAALGAASLPAAAFATSADDAADAAARPRGVEAERAHARAWQAYRLEAARRVVAANPELTFTSQAPTDLLAVHALRIVVDADGRVRRFEVVRRSSYGRGTLEIAEHAIRRAAPFGDARALPRPWSFTETLLFTEDRRFKPLALQL